MTPLIGVAITCALIWAPPTVAHPKKHPHPTPHHCSAVAEVWSPARWRRARPKTKVVAELHACPNWRKARKRFRTHRRRMLAANSIDHRWAAHWAPDWGGPTLRPYVIAALAEKAGDVVGVDVPGWTMEQVSIGESGRRPGSAGVDVGGTIGWGLWAVTDPFANSILARHGWGYEDMLDPVRNAVAMAEIYASQGLGAWYGTSHVTSTDRHYRGHFDLRLVLGGRSLRQVVAG